MEKQRKCYVCSERIAVKGQSMCSVCRKKYNADRWAERKPIIDKYLGTRCVICGDIRNLRCHEINGEEHPRLLSTSLEDVRANCRAERFARVCARCHGKAHALMDKGFAWEEIRIEIKGFLKTLKRGEKQRLAWHRWKRKNYGE